MENNETYQLGEYCPIAEDKMQRAWARNSYIPGVTLINANWPYAIKDECEIMNTEKNI